MGHIIYVTYREPSSGVKYIVTDKESNPYMSFKEQTIWTFVGLVKDKLGPGPYTLGEIYRGVTYPLGRLSIQDTRSLVNSAIDLGYMKKIRGIVK